jgi:queuosine precursor transporter
MIRAEPAGRPGAAPPDTAAGVVASREARLFMTLAGLSIANAIIAGSVGVRILALEHTPGVAPFDWCLFGRSSSLSFTAGVVLRPFVFIPTDVINEHFGLRGLRLVSRLAVGTVNYCCKVAMAIALIPLRYLGRRLIRAYLDAPARSAA